MAREKRETHDIGMGRKRAGEKRRCGYRCHGRTRKGLGVGVERRNGGGEYGGEEGADIVGERRERCGKDGGLCGASLSRRVSGCTRRRWQ